MSDLHTFQSSVDSKLITISVMNNKSYLEHAHDELELIYVIKGNLQLKVNSKVFQMKSSDFLLVNSNDFHSLHSEQNNLFVVLHFNYFELCSLFNKPKLLFSCNSVDDVNILDLELKINIEELLSVYMKQNFESRAEFFEKAYKLISSLTHYIKNRDHLENISYSSSTGQNDRLTEIIDYIQNNYREPLSLEEVANLNYISIPYLSKYFKQQMGKTFSQYLKEIRLAHAVNDLVNTNKPIIRIALDNGFPNLASFNRVFNDVYNLKPVEYRKQMKKTVKNQEDPPKTINQEKDQALTELSQYLNNTVEVKNKTTIQTSSTLETHTIEMGQCKLDAFTKYWNKLINIGYATDILNSDMQSQITLLQNEIQFKYARFWGLLSDEMRVEHRSEGTISYNFSNTNKVLDFLIKVKCKPFIELGPKPRIISKTTDETLIIQTLNDKPLEEWKNLIRAFLLHCIERYGIDEVETWYFEIWSNHIDPIVEDDSSLLNSLPKNKQFELSELSKYFNIFSELKRNIKEIVPSAKVGGCGLSMDLEDEYLDLLLQQWKSAEIQPDFLSVYLYPIESYQEKNSVPIKNRHSYNPSYVKSKLNQVRSSLKKAGLNDLELNVTEWNISISNRDYLNDSCFKSSYMTKTIIENLNENKVNMIGYWMSSDIFSDFGDSKNLLYGGAGLITKSGIKKPSYHTFVLLKQLGEILVAKGNYYIVTKKSGDRYQIICFNYKHFNYSYYLHPEGSAGIHEQYDIFENNELLPFSLDIQGVKDGKYRIKEHKLNRNYGSVLDEWIKFGAVEDIKQDEVEYLKQVCSPLMQVEHTLVENQTITIKGELQPHEVRLFEINLMLGER